MQSDAVLEERLFKNANGAGWKNGGWHRLINATTEATTAMVDGRLSHAQYRELVDLANTGGGRYNLGLLMLEVDAAVKAIRRGYEVTIARLHAFFDEYLAPHRRE